MPDVYEIADGLPAYQRDALFAAADLVGRAGGKQFEIGYVRDDVPKEEAGWYASAEFHQGGTLRVDEQPDPIIAAERLARRILDGGTCTHCGRIILLTGDIGPTRSNTYCRWFRERDSWRRGCER